MARRRLGLASHNGPSPAPSFRHGPPRSPGASRHYRRRLCAPARNALLRQNSLAIAATSTNLQKRNGCRPIPRRANASRHFSMASDDNADATKRSAPMRLDGKRVLITGGASGIGKATVLEFARCGAQVICADINDAKAAEVAKEAAAAGLAIETVAVDLADPKSARRCAADVI